MDGMQYLENESVEIASIKYIKLALFHSGDFLFKKLFLPRKICNKKMNALIPNILNFSKNKFVDNTNRIINS